MGQAIIATSVNRRCLSLLVCALVVATAWAQEPTEPSVEELIEQLKSSERSVRKNASEALRKIGPEGVPVLIEALKDESELVRRNAAIALGRIGADAKATVPALSAALKDEDYGVRSYAAMALGNIGPEAVPALSEALKDERYDVRWAAGDFLGRIGPEGVSALSDALKDENDLVREAAAIGLQRIGPEGVSALIEMFEDENPEVRMQAVEALASSGPKAVPALIEALKDENDIVRWYAAETLGNIGPDAKAAVPPLIDALKDVRIDVRWLVAEALGSIGPEAKPAVPALCEALKDENSAVRGEAAAALGNIGSDAKGAGPILSEALKDADASVRRNAATALGNIGPEPKVAVPALNEALKDEDADVRGNAAVSMGNIAQGLQEAKDTASLPNLEKALVALTSGEFTEELVRPVRMAVDALRDRAQIERNRWSKQLLRLAQRHPWIWGVAIVELGLFAIWVLLLCFSPLTLLMINEALDAFLNEKMKIKYKGFEGSAPVKLLLLVGFFHYHRRVLDAWVDKHIDTARENFKTKKTVAARQSHVPIPAVLDNKPVASIGPGELSHACRKHRWCVLIHGEGGAGKTSLACQIAHWAMANDSASRLCEHRLLPVLIEYELDQTIENSKHRFLEAIRGQLQDLVGEAETLSPGLLEPLLRRQRILVIVDHFSEMSEETRQAIRPSDAAFLPYALVVTSRQEEELDGVIRTTIQPRRIDGNRLSSFMESYLTQLGKRELFDDAEYFDACRKLSLMVAERDITVLLAKLYADQLVSVKEQDGDSPLPDNIPDLMLQYLKILNRGRTEDEPDNATVHGIAKIVAWECLQQTYRPGSAKRSDILSSLKDIDHADKHLKYLEARLRVIRSAGESDEKLLFELDPLAEYLAGLHLVELYRDNEERWREFFSRADAQTGAPESIKGFLLAVRDCCLAKKKEADWDIPDFVVKELDKRAGLDPEVLRQARLQQRVQRLIINLNAPEVEDRRAAAEALEKIGPDAKAAVPALVEALKDEDDNVCWPAAQALVTIGSAAKAAVPALIELLTDEGELVRRRAAMALVNIGPEGKRAVPALIEALTDEDVDVRRDSAMALGNIGPEAKTAVPALLDALKDERGDGRWVPAKALGKIGPDAKAAVAALVEALKDEIWHVRSWTAEALGRIGREAKAAVPALIETLNDEDRVVRMKAAVALGNIGPEAKGAVPALREALKDEHEFVRRTAAVALGSIGPEATAAVPALIEALKGEDEIVRRNAAAALRNIGPEGKAALSEVLSDNIHKKGNEALRQIKGESDNHT